jgi:sortase A
MTALLPDRPGTVLHHGAVDASPPPTGDQELARIGASQVLLAVSLVVTFVLCYLFVLSGLEQGRAQSALYDQLRSELAEGTAPLGAPIALGSPVALLSIPGAGIEDAVVVEGTRSAQLQDGPGHSLGSVLPGQQGTSVLAGRSLSFGGPFAHIDDLRAGDPITVTTGQGVFVYSVTGIRREGDPTSGAPAAGTSRLTLKTAARSGLRASDLVFVDADLTEGAVTPGPRAATDTVDSMSGNLDASTLALLALALQLLVGALGAFVWAWVRWSRPAAWIAGAPCVLAALWLACSVGTRLLPALI